MQSIAQISGGLGLPALILVAWGLSGCTQSVPVSTATSGAAAVGSGGTSPTVTPPAIQGTPATTIVAGTPYYFQPTVAESTSALTYTIVNPPAWASFSAGTGALYGVPPLDSLGTTAKVAITASNGASASTIGPFDITVTASPTAPPLTQTPIAGGTATLTWVAPKLDAAGKRLTDLERLTGLAGYHIYYGTDAAKLTQEVMLTGSETTTYVVRGLGKGTYYFSVSAVNSLGVESPRSNLGRKTF